jgi:dihydropteroate synthase
MTRSTEPDRTVVAARPDLGGGVATPSFRLPSDAASGLPAPPQPLRIGPTRFDWRTRTFVMGILNLTPDSFSGDGLLAVGGDPVRVAVERGRQMVADGADLLDVGGESSRPGHSEVSATDETARVVPVIAALREALPGTPISIDTTKAAVAEAALDAGAHLVNDVWGVSAEGGIVELAAERSVPIVLMHNRAEPRYTNLLPEIVADLQAAIERALGAGVGWESIIVDPGFGFGKTYEHNLALLRDLAMVRVLGRPILLGTSRKSTLGRVLDLPADQRVEATVATTVLGIAAGVDIVRVHDVRPNARAARMTDAIIRRVVAPVGESDTGEPHAGGPDAGGPDAGDSVGT